MRIAHLGSSNDAGIELFEFIEPAVVIPEQNFPFATVGLHHVALTVPDFEEPLERLLARGRCQRCSPSEILAGVLVCYCEDPWGQRPRSCQRRVRRPWACHHCHRSPRPKIVAGGHCDTADCLDLGWNRGSVAPGHSSRTGRSEQAQAAASTAACSANPAVAVAWSSAAMKRSASSSAAQSVPAAASR
jgi:hypothetical protein